MSSEEDFAITDDDDTPNPKRIALVERKKKKLRILRGQAKGAITRIENFIKNLDGSLDTDEAHVRKIALDDHYRKFQKHESSLLLLGDAEDEDDIEERYLQLCMRFQKLKNLQPSQPTDTQGANVTKLPPIDVPTFDGRDIADYRPFIELFQAVIHGDPKLSDVQRLYYLKKYVKGEPLQLINNLPLINRSYIDALKILDERYNNSPLLINNHCNVLLDLPNMHRGTAQQLRELVARVKQQLTALKNLNQPVEGWDALVVCLITRKLDPLTVRLFHADRDTKVVPTTNNLLFFLEKRACSMEASPSNFEKFNKSKTVLFIKNDPNNINIKKCKLCNDNHRLFKCPKFLLISTTKRLEFVNKQKMCKVCLGQHPQHKCRYRFKCSACESPDHNTLLHPDVVQPVQTAHHNIEKTTNNEQVSLCGTGAVQSNILLPTVKILVSDNQNNKYIVRALLDCGSQTSFCTFSLCNKLGIEPYNLQKNIMTLGQNFNKTSKGIDLTIHSMTENFKCNVTCSLVNQITNLLPQTKISLNNFKFPNNIMLADNEFNIPGEISILLAADIFFRVIKDGKIHGGPADPIMINTHFGYIVSGDSFPICNLSSITMHTVACPDLDSYVKRFWETEQVPEVYLETLPEHE